MANKTTVYNTKEYKVWNNMIGRCYCLGAINAADYSGRGITVCERWRFGENGKTGFECFLEDMGNQPIDTTFDRENVNGNYCKENCRWDNWSLQNYNQRMRSTNTSGRTGVCWDSSVERWSARICKENNKILLGKFKTFEEAVAAREAAELKYFGFIKQ